VNIKFKANGAGELRCNGISTVFNCAGVPGVMYPKDLTVNGKAGTSDGKPPDADKFFRYYSKEHNVIMKHSILIWGQRGIHIHESTHLNPTNGCIYLLKGDAKRVYDYVNGKTRIVISYPW